MGRKRTRFETLDLQLEAIVDTLAMAQRESSPERRAQLLLVVERAFAAYHEEHKAAVLARPRLRLLQGGATVGALAHPVVWWHEMHGEQRALAMGLIAAAVGAGALAIAVLPGGGGERPPLSAPTAIASQTAVAPPRAEAPRPAQSSPSPAPDTITPGLSAPEARQTPQTPSGAGTSPPMEPSPAIPENPSTPRPGSPGPSTDPERPPGGSGDEDDQESPAPPEPTRPPAEEQDPRCLLDLELSLSGINLGARLCL